MTTENDAPDTDSHEAEFDAAREAYEADGSEDVNDEADKPEEESAPDPVAEKLREAEEKYNNLQKALAKERGKVKEVNRSQEAMAKRLAELEAKLAPNEPDIDEEEDPIGAIKQLRARLAAAEKAKEQAQKPQSNPHAARLTELQTMESEFAAENPEYTPAAEFFGAQLRSELEDEGFAGAALDTEYGKRLMDLVDRAEKSDTHPGELIIKLAKKRGFDPSKPASGVATDEAVAKAKAEVDALRKANANKSLGGMAAAGKDNGLGVDAYMKASDKDKDAIWEKMRQQAKREGAY